MPIHRYHLLFSGRSLCKISEHTIELPRYGPLDGAITNSTQADRGLIAPQSLFQVFGQLVGRAVLLRTFTLVRSFHTKLGVRVSVRLATETGVSLIVERAVLQPQLANKSPDLSIMPINHRVNANKIWPTTICPIKMSQLRAMGIRPPGPDKDRLNTGM